MSDQAIREFLVAIRRVRQIARRVRNATGATRISYSEMRFSERRTMEKSGRIIREALEADLLCSRIKSLSMLIVEMLQVDYLLSTINTKDFNWYVYRQFYHCRNLDLTDAVESFHAMLDASPKAMVGHLAMIKLSLA